MNQGFSLTEVLLSILLITSTSVALLKQQWQISQLFNQIHTRGNALSHLDNAVERLQSNYDLETTASLFHLQYTRIEQIITLEMNWKSPVILSPNCCTMKRQLVVG